MSARLVVVCADSALGRAAVELLAAREFPAERLTLVVDDPADVGPVSFGNQRLKPLAAAEFRADAEHVILLADDTSSPANFPAAAAVIHGNPPPDADTPAYPVVAEVNAADLHDLPPGSVVTNPGAASVFLGLLLKPLVDAHAVRRVSVCGHYPAVARGQAGVEELAGQTARLLNGLQAEQRAFPRQVAFNLDPQMDAPDASGATPEEQRLGAEVRQILHDPTLPVTATCIQVGVFYALSQVVEIEFEQAVSAADVAALLKRSPALKMSRAGTSPTAADEQPDADRLQVARVRQSGIDGRSVTLWCTGDYLRRGRALNAVQIAEILIKGYL